MEIENRDARPSGRGLVLACCLSLFSAPSPALPVFINEIHYDNVGADDGEAVELAGVAGTLLDGWRLQLYDGRRGRPYSTLVLNGALADAGDGTGFLTLYHQGIQNGSPDGLALIDAEGVVRQFISYEGAFIALEGAAAGLTSTDIGTMEPANTPLGQSLQLSGQGGDYGDFSWLLAPATFGAVNVGQSFSPTPAVVPLPGASLLLLSGLLLFHRRSKGSG